MKEHLINFIVVFTILFLVLVVTADSKEDRYFEGAFIAFWVALGSSLMLRPVMNFIKKTVKNK